MGEIQLGFPEIISHLNWVFVTLCECLYLVRSWCILNFSSYCQQSRPDLSELCFLLITSTWPTINHQASPTHKCRGRLYIHPFIKALWWRDCHGLVHKAEAYCLANFVPSFRSIALNHIIFDSDRLRNVHENIQREHSIAASAFLGS